MSLRRSCSSPAYVLCVLCLLSLAIPSGFAAAQEKPLRYGWSAGETLMYSVTVEADRGDYWDVLKGRPSFHVKSADGDNITVTFSGTLGESQKAKPGKRLIFRGPRRSMFSPFTGVSGSRPGGGNELTINPRGEVVSSRGSSQLPFLLGNLSQLMLERLPEAAEKTWKHEREISISESSSRIPVPSFLRERDQKVTKATEVTTYTIEESNAETVALKRTYELKTAETIDGKPKFHISGKGDLTFDRKRGAFSKLEYQQTITVRDGNDVRETPVTVSYQLLSEEEQKEALANAATARAEAAAPPTAAERDEILADLKTNEQGKFLRRLQQLQQKSPKEPDEEMAGALEVFLVSENRTHRFLAAKALENWATEKSTDALLKAMDDDFNIVSASAMQALAGLKAKEAAAPIAAKLADQQSRLGASKALVAMGALAEEPVIKQLKNDEWQVRLEACRILDKIGGEKSVEALQSLSGDGNALVKRTAGETIKAIEKRLSAPQT